MVVLNSAATAVQKVLKRESKDTALVKGCGDRMTHM